MASFLVTLTNIKPINCSVESFTDNQTIQSTLPSSEELTATYCKNIDIYIDQIEKYVDSETIVVFDMDEVLGTVNQYTNIYTNESRYKNYDNDNFALSTEMLKDKETRFILLFF